MATVKSFKGNVSSVSPSSEWNGSFETLYGGQLPLSTQLIILNYLVILLRHYSFFRNLPPLQFWQVFLSLFLHGLFICSILLLDLNWSLKNECDKIIFICFIDSKPFWWTKRHLSMFNKREPVELTKTVIGKQYVYD